jgi:hypothetical protein
MAVTPAVQEFLRRVNVAYTVFPHPRAYTAQAEAAEWIFILRVAANTDTTWTTGCGQSATCVVR